MATPVWLTGFEYGLATPVISGTGLIDAIVGACTIRTDAVTPRGTYSLRTVATAAVLAYISRNMTAGQTFVGRFYIYLPALPASDRIIFSITTVGHAIQILYDVTQVSFSIGIDGATTQLGTVTVAINTWYCIDIKAVTSANPWLIDWQIDSVAQTQLTSAHAAENMSVIDYGLRTVGILTAWYDDIVHSLTSGDYPLGPGGTFGLRPSSDGVHNNAANTMENSAGTDIDGTPAWSLLDENPWTSSIASDYVRQATIGAARYCEINFEDVPGGMDTGFIGVEGLLQYGASGTAADTGGCIIRDGATETTVWGRVGALSDYSETTAFYKHAIVTPAAAPWTHAAIDGLQCRFGYSDDVTDIPRWVEIMLEVAYSVPASSILMTNAAEEVEWQETTNYIRMTNAAEEVEWHETTDYIRMTNAAIMVEWRIGAIGYSASHAHLANNADLVVHNPATAGVAPVGEEAVVIKSIATSTFVQLEPGKELYFLGECVTLDGIDNPRTDVSPIVRRVGQNKWEVVTERASSLGNIGFTIERLHSKTVSWLDRVECPFTLFSLQKCTWLGRGNYWDWVTGQAVRQCLIINDPISPLSQRASADEMRHSYEVVAYPPRYDYYQMIVEKLVVSHFTAANCLALCSDTCNDGCDGSPFGCQGLFVGFDHAPALQASIKYSLDGGTTWTTTTAPFSTLADVIAIECLKLSTTLTRILAFPTVMALVDLVCVYSDDMGTTWTTVQLDGTIVSHGVLSPNAFKVFNYLNMWVGTDLGRIYFSGDSGESWNEQTSALTATAGADIYGIDFLTSDVGVAVGVGFIMYTRDGGVTWTTVTPPAAITYYDVQVFSPTRWLVGASNGYSYMTYDGGVNWTRLANFYGASTGSVRGFDFVDELNGFMLHVNAAGVGTLHRTIDGGYSWVYIDSKLYTSLLNEVVGCNVNEAFAVGEVDASTRAVVAHAYHEGT